MPKKDYYETLGISKNASIDDIKKAYRKLALKHHPDRNKGEKESETKFKEINEAYQILSDPAKKQQYDRFGSYQDIPNGDGRARGGFEGFEGFDFSGFSGSAGSNFGFEDIFETFFGSGGSRRGGQKRQAQGEDLNLHVNLSFEEAVFGTEKEITIDRKETCSSCHGTGAEPGTKIINCSTCRGSGQVEYIQRTFLGSVRSVSICNDCQGEGRIPEKKCSACRGKKRVTIRDTFSVKIPAGVENQTTLRMNGKGNAGEKEGTTGNLYITLSVEQSKKFKREKNDIHSSLEISNIEAVLGNEISIDTIYGKKNLQIPKGIQDGEMIRLKDLGVQQAGGYKKGDHYVTIKIKIPKKLSKEEEKLYQELMKLQKK